MEENTLHRENLAWCILYGNTVVWCIDTLKLRMSPGRHSKIPSQQGLWRHSKFKNQHFGKLVSVLSFDASLYNIYNIHIYIHISPFIVYPLRSWRFPWVSWPPWRAEKCGSPVIASWSMAISPTPWCRRCGADRGRGWRPLVIGKGFTSGIGWGLRKHEFMIIYRDSKGLKPQTHGGINDGWLNWEVLHGDTTSLIDCDNQWQDTY